ncbi:MAG: carbamoyltransferase C-terminal domain-containing protein [Candidatus Sulfotelmatobacter sp.]
MLCVGFSGGLNLIHENPFEQEFGHDGAAVLVEDGEVIAAIEEERLNRIKHSDKFPVNALRFCLNRRGIKPHDVDCFAFYASEQYCNYFLNQIAKDAPGMSIPDARTLAHGRLQQALECEIGKERIRFVVHRLAHAASTFALSGLDESLVAVFDAGDDSISGMVGIGQGSIVTEIETFPQCNSLGVFYLRVIRHLGYQRFDEYKVMGLAPYGNPATYREAFSQTYKLLPNGEYKLFLDEILPSLNGHIEIRKKGQPFTQQHKDLAASLQAALEEIVMHVLRHRREATGQRNLCLAGGVAHNCTMNGKVLHSGMFDHVFVQPAAHDAGCALGAALLMCQEKGSFNGNKRMQHVYLGTDIGTAEDIALELEGWRSFISVEKSADIARQTAALMAQGSVVGWVQGKSEFGPRALGNRSILADPRPAENKDRINLMVKKREGYRPFAPSVLEEDVRESFDFPSETDSLPFMIFVVGVREDKRAQLGAITHIDGTARVQTVSRETNPRYWDLIHAFKELTGIPVLLNTSFNNNVEPIVDSVEDAVVSFLTTGLDYLVAGDFIARKLSPSWKAWLSLNISLPRYVTLQQNRSAEEGGHEIHTTYDKNFRFFISPEMHKLLLKVDREKLLSQGFQEAGLQSETKPEVLLRELEKLWTERLVCLRPTRTGNGGLG